MKDLATKSAHARWSLRALVSESLSLLVLGAHALPVVAQNPEVEPPPPGVDQLRPRGRIPAVFEPTFVSADEAEIPCDAWVLGIEIEGEARAYSVNLLNQHEVVNDRLGDRPIAAVW